jgi:RNA polymerase sigma-B factor
MRSVEVLSQRRGRSPTIEELAEEAGAPFDVVLEALEAGRAYAPASLEAETADDGTNDRVTSLAELIGDRDPTLGQLEDHEALEWAMRKLPRPLQEIVRLRFFTHLSQTEIAEKLGISQMHVSRKLRESLGRLKSLMAS